MAFTTICFTEVKLIDNDQNIVNVLLEKHFVFWEQIANETRLVTYYYYYNTRMRFCKNNYVG